VSYTRWARGVRNLGGFAGGTSRLARPPAVLAEPDVRPSTAPAFPAVALGEWWAEGPNPSETFVDGDRFFTWDNQVPGGPPAESFVATGQNAEPRWFATGFNGLPCATFSTANTDDFIRATYVDQTPVGTYPYSVVLVANLTSYISGESEPLVGSLRLGVRPVSGGEPWAIDTNDTSTDGGFSVVAHDLDPHVFSAIYNGTDSHMWVDGVELDLNIEQPTAMATEFGSIFQVTFSGECSVAYGKVWTGILTDAQRVERENWAISHYGL